MVAMVFLDIFGLRHRWTIRWGRTSLIPLTDGRRRQWGPLTVIWGHDNTRALQAQVDAEASK